MEQRKRALWAKLWLVGFEALGVCLSALAVAAILFMGLAAILLRGTRGGPWISLAAMLGVSALLAVMLAPCAGPMAGVGVLLAGVSSAVQFALLLWGGDTEWKTCDSGQESPQMT